MKITVFCSQKHTKEGKGFLVYSTKLVNVKSGEEVYANVKFVGDPNPIKKEDCPCILTFDKKDGNMSKRRFTTKDGKEGENLILWLKNFTVSDEQYVDHSLDDFASIEE